MTDEPSEVEARIPPAEDRGALSARALYARNNKVELRMRAAEVWVETEEAGNRPDKDSIAKTLGFAGARRYMPAFLAEPEFGRAVEFERVKRLAQGTNRMNKNEIAVFASMIARAGLIEVARRFVLQPETISTRDLLPETRNYARLAAEVQDPAEGRGIRQTINVFFAAAERLPPKARDRYLAMYDDSMRRLSLASGQAREKATK